MVRSHSLCIAHPYPFLNCRTADSTGVEPIGALAQRLWHFVPSVCALLTNAEFRRRHCVREEDSSIIVATVYEIPGGNVLEDLERV